MNVNHCDGKGNGDCMHGKHWNGLIYIHVCVCMMFFKNKHSECGCIQIQREWIYNFIATSTFFPLFFGSQFLLEVLNGSRSDCDAITVDCAVKFKNMFLNSRFFSFLLLLLLIFRVVLNVVHSMEYLRIRFLWMEKYLTLFVCVCVDNHLNSVSISVVLIGFI